MLNEDIKAFVNRFEAAFNAGKPEAIDALFAPDFVDHAPWPGQSADLDGFKAGLVDMRQSFPGLCIAILRTVAGGDLLTLHARISGTQRGVFMGAPASDKFFGIEAIDIVRMTDGKIAEHWGVLDTAGMAEQLGL